MARSEPGDEREQEPMSADQLEKLRDAAEQMRADTHQYLEAHGIAPDEYEYDPALSDEG